MRDLKIAKPLAGRNIGIDILRGMCILFVILLHLNIHFGLRDSFLKEVLPKEIFSLLFWNGFYGVVVFFTLSGYLITRSTIQKWETLPQVNLKAFYWLRFSRIIPMLASLLFVLAILHMLSIKGFVINQEQTSLGRAIFSALTFHINWLEIQVGYLPANWDVLWSISIEEIFYLGFPIVCLCLRKEGHFGIVLGLFLIVSPWARTQLFVGNELGDRNHLAFLDSISLGCMAAIIAHRMTFPKWLSRTFLAMGWSMVIMILVFKRFVYKSGLVDLGLNVTLLSLGVSCILFWMHENHRLGQEKNRIGIKWLREMGMYSYEIYLTHMFVVLLGVSIYKHFEISETWLVPFLLLLVYLSYGLGKLVFTYFSEPINQWLRRKM